MAGSHPLVAELTELIRLGRDETCRDVASFVADALADAGAGVRRVTGEDGREGLFATFGEARVVFSGHLDVVPAGEGWPEDVDPFAGERRGDDVWGRGAVDMKSGVAAMLALARERPDGVGFAFTTDEETRMSTARALADAGFLDRVRIVVIGEPTSLDVGVAQKGILWLRVTTRGRGAHASMPQEGENAIDRLIPLLTAVGGVRLDEAHPLTGPGTVNLGVVRGGERPNVVPDHAEAVIDVRYPPVLDAEEVVARFRKALAATGIRHSLALDMHHRAVAADVAAPDVARVLAAVRATGLPGRTIGLPYGTDGSKFVDAGPAIVTLGPGRREFAHTPSERIHVAELPKALAAYRAIAEAHAP